MNSDVVCIESDPEDDVCIISAQEQNTSDVILIEEPETPSRNGSKDPIELDPEPGPSSAASIPVAAARSPVKRVQPTLISNTVTSPSKKKEFGIDASPERAKKRGKVPKGDFGSFKRTRIMKLSDNALDLEDGSDEEPAPAPPPPKPNSTSAVAADEKITKEFRNLIQTCKTVDSSVDMDKCLRKKLIGYYKEVPAEFVNSKSFRDLVNSVVGEIKQAPHLIYLKLNRIVDELKPRRRTVFVKQELVEGENDNGADAGVSAEEAKKSAKKAAQIKKLNKALVQLKKRIDELDQEEVDWDEDMNSAHMKVERYKKRACQIYEKLCDISGESKHAQRSARKPIKFHGTVYPEFNKTLQAFVNRTNIFPDFYDVKKCLEHCDKQYNMKLRPEEIKLTAQDAFVKVGKILQKRRKIDLYEMISYFSGNDQDPADEDADLQDKLGQNKQHHSKISDLIDKFADQQSAEKGGDDDDEGHSDENGDDEDVKFNVSSYLESSMSVGDEGVDGSNGGEGVDKPLDKGPKSDEIILVDSQVKGEVEILPSQESLRESSQSQPKTSQPTTNSQDPESEVAMNDAIDFLVARSGGDAFAMPEVDLLQENQPPTDIN